jgi:hypothetical protein
MNDGVSRARVRLCPKCRMRADLVPNPFYGVSLSTHEYLVICTHCEFFEYVPGVRPEEDAATPTPPPRRWLGRMGHAVFRRHSKDD